MRFDGMKLKRNSKVGTPDRKHGNKTKGRDFHNLELPREVWYDESR